MQRRSTYQDRLMPLHKAIFIEPGLCGAKYALNRTRGMNRTVRLPLMATLEASTEAAIDAGAEACRADELTQ
jgi:4-hydroxy-tetrahydrodipicolinate synthase